MPSIKQYSNEVNMTVQQAKSMTWTEIAKFVVFGFFKLAGLATALWIIRHI